MSRIAAMPVSSVYPLYLKKVEKKGRSAAELDEIIRWLTGFSQEELQGHLAAETTFEKFFADARLNENADLITGVICGVRVEEIDDPFMKKVRYLDKIVDELARGKAVEKIMRSRA